MYKAVRTYTLLPGSSEKFLQRVQESLTCISLVNRRVFRIKCFG